MTKASIFRRLLAATLIAFSAACTVHQSEAPPLAGPSDLSVRIDITATPDTINQDGGSQSAIKITLKYTPERRPTILGLKRVSKPGLRVYRGRTELPAVQGGLGIAILSTSRGVMTDREARRSGIGGEILCEVW